MVNGHHSNAVDVAEPRYTERAAAEALGISLAMLRSERYAGRIGYLRLGTRKIAYRQHHLNEYEQRCEVQPTDPVKSETTGSAKIQKAPTGAERGSTRSADKLAALRSAQMMRMRRLPDSLSGTS